jgi:hypothetical protein
MPSSQQNHTILTPTPPGEEGEKRFFFVVPLSLSRKGGCEDGREGLGE